MKKIDMKIYEGGNWKVIASVELSEGNYQRFKMLQKTPEGNSILRTIYFNHKVGLMDANEAPEKFFQ